MMKKFSKIVTMVLALSLVAVLSVAFASCNNPDKGGTSKGTLRFAMPDGTPALAAASLFSSSATLGGYDMDYQIVDSSAIPTEMGAAKADCIIMPTNAGANLIKNKNAVYKMVAVSVLGSLYVVGTDPNSDGKITLDELKGKTIASIGDGNTPGIVFKYIVDNTDGVTYRRDDASTAASASDITVKFYADAAAIRTDFIDADKSIDYALIGEPAVTAWKNAAATKDLIEAEYDVSAAWKDVTGYDNFPQASLFVKASLCSDAEFMSALLTALDRNVEWVSDNKATVTEYLKTYGSNSTFPAPSIARCAVTNLKASANKDMVNNYLVLMVKGWTEPDGFFYEA